MCMSRRLNSSFADRFSILQLDCVLRLQNVMQSAAVFTVFPNGMELS